MRILAACDAVGVIVSILEQPTDVCCATTQTLKKFHLETALAMSLGWATAEDMRVALQDGVEIERPFTGKAFAHHVAAITGVTLPGWTLLQATIVAAPEVLVAETEGEGILVAVALEVDRLRGGAWTYDNGEVHGIALDLEHLGGHEFDCTVSEFADYNRTIWIENDGEEALAFLNGDLAELNHVVDNFDTDWIANYVSPEQQNIQGNPSYDSGVYYNGVGVEVWPRAVRYTIIDRNNNVIRKVINIDTTTYRKLSAAMRVHAYGDAQRVVEAKRIVPLEVH